MWEARKRKGVEANVRKSPIWEERSQQTDESCSRVSTQSEQNTHRGFFDKECLILVRTWIFFAIDHSQKRTNSEGGWHVYAYCSVQQGRGVCA